MSLRGTDLKKQNRKFHKSLMRQTPKNPPVQKGSALSTKLGIVNSKQRASNLTDPYQEKKKEPDKRVFVRLHSLEYLKLPASRN